jgi:hypothetical protein
LVVNSSVISCPFSFSLYWIFFNDKTWLYGFYLRVDISERLHFGLIFCFRGLNEVRCKFFFQSSCTMWKKPRTLHYDYLVWLDQQCWNTLPHCMETLCSQMTAPRSIVNENMSTCICWWFIATLTERTRRVELFQPTLTLHPRCACFAQAFHRPNQIL